MAGCVVSEERPACGWVLAHSDDDELRSLRGCNRRSAHHRMRLRSLHCSMHYRYSQHCNSRSCSRIWFVSSPWLVLRVRRLLIYAMSRKNAISIGNIVIENQKNSTYTASDAADFDEFGKH